MYVFDLNAHYNPNLLNVYNFWFGILLGRTSYLANKMFLSVYE